MNMMRWMGCEAALTRSLWALAVAVVAAALAACAAVGEPPEGPPRKDMVYAVTDAAELIRFNAGQPQRILDRKKLVGLAMDERLVGLDFRVARGVLYALSSQGRLFTVNASSGQLTRVGSQTLTLQGTRFAMDFNPVPDRIRVMSDTGMNQRLHPDTAAAVASDPAPFYSPGDVAYGKQPVIAATSYTYNKRNDKLTSNYAIDIAAGTLVLQGTKEGAVPEISPNTGQLFTVGALGTGPLEDASMDTADIDNTTLAALCIAGRTRLYAIDLASGRATLLGTVGDGRSLWGLAIEP